MDDELDFFNWYRRLEDVLKVNNKEQFLIDSEREAGGYYNLIIRVFFEKHIKLESYTVSYSREAKSMLKDLESHCMTDVNSKYIWDEYLKLELNGEIDEGKAIQYVKAFMKLQNFEIDYTEKYKLNRICSANLMFLHGLKGEYHEFTRNVETANFRDHTDIINNDLRELVSQFYSFVDISVSCKLAAKERSKMNQEISRNKLYPKKLIRCYNCGKQGHYKTNCYANKSRNKQNYKGSRARSNYVNRRSHNH